MLNVEFAALLTLFIIGNSSVRTHQRWGSARFWTAPSSHSVLSDSIVHIDMVAPLMLVYPR